MALLLLLPFSLSAMGGGPYMDLHGADSLTLVRRNWLPEDAGATASADVRVEMVRNERESGQLVVVVRSYANQAAKGITWAVSPLLDVSRLRAVPVFAAGADQATSACGVGSTRAAAPGSGRCGRWTTTTLPRAPPSPPPQNLRLPYAASLRLLPFVDCRATATPGCQADGVPIKDSEVTMAPVGYVPAGPCTRHGPFNSTRMGVNSTTFGSPHVCPQGAYVW